MEKNGKKGRNIGKKGLTTGRIWLNEAKIRYRNVKEQEKNGGNKGEQVLQSGKNVFVAKSRKKCPESAKMAGQKSEKGVKLWQKLFKAEEMG